MHRFTLGILGGCCALAGPAALAGAQGDSAPPPSDAFPKSVNVLVSPLDLVYRGNLSSANSVYCSRYDEAGCAGSKLRVTLTVTAATAKAGGISKRQISSIVKTLSGNAGRVGFKHHLSSSTTRKLKKLEKARKKIKMVISVSVTKGAETRKAPSKVMTGPAGADGQGRPYTFQFGELVDQSGGGDGPR